MRNYIVIGLIMLLVVLGFIVFDKYNQIDDIKVGGDLISNSKGFNEELKDNYIGSCMAQGLSKDFCNCVVDYLMGVYGRDGVIQMSAEIINNPYKYPDELREASEFCSYANEKLEQCLKENK